MFEPNVHDNITLNPMNTGLTGQGFAPVSLDELTPKLLQSQLQGADLSFAMGDPLTALKVSQGLAKATEFLAQFAASGSFTDKLAVAFGDDFDRGIAQGVGLEWAKDNFGDLPKIQVLSAQAMGGANGAYASSTNTVYLSKDFVDHSSLNAIISVTLEEIGHSVDARINSVDTAGDEGDIFSRIVQNQTLDNAQLAALKVEDDHGLISVGGVQVAIEKNDSLGTAENLGTLNTSAYYRRGWVGSNVPNDFYKLYLNNTSNFSVSLTGLGADVDVFLLNSSGNRVAKSDNSNTSSEYFNVSSLGAGQYYLQVYRWSGDSRNSYYDLSLNATPIGNYVGFYEHDRYLGNSMILGEGNYNYVGNSWNDRISAINIPQGLTVEAFEHDNYNGASMVFSGSTSYVGNTWNDRISSVKIYRDRPGIVANFYRDILGREPDQGGLNSYVNNYLTLTQIRYSIGHSGEATNLVSNLYRNILGREPDQGGLNSYLNNLGNGWSLGNVRYSIGHSSEATNLVSNLYRNILGREPDQGGLNSYLDNLGNGWSLGSVRYSISHSAEATNLVTQAYSNYLQRVPDATGLQSYLDAMGNGSTLASVRSSIANSDEARKIQQVGQWRGEYFNNRNLSGYSTFARIDGGNINNDWVLGSPGGGVGNDNFSVRWTGKFDFGSGSDYVFHTLSDDGIRLWIDGNLAVDQWNDHGPTEYNANRNLSGVHQLKVEYYENGGGATAKVWWEQKPIDLAGNSKGEARNIGTLNSQQQYADWVGNGDSDDYYRFSVDAKSNFNLSLTGNFSLTGNTKVQLQTAPGYIISDSSRSGLNSESISNYLLDPGTYYVRVYQFSGNTNYNLTVSASYSSGSVVVPVDNSGWQKVLQDRNNDFPKNPKLTPENISKEIPVSKLADTWSITGNDDAAELLYHYLDSNNGGGNYKIDFNEAIQESSAYRNNILNGKLLNSAWSKISSLVRSGYYLGQVNDNWITPTGDDWGNDNWKYAVGGHHLRYSSNYQYNINTDIVTIDVQFFLKDVYDFAGFNTSLPGFIDDIPYQLHLAGLARAFEVTGESSTYKWQYRLSDGALIRDGFTGIG